MVGTLKRSNGWQREISRRTARDTSVYARYQLINELSRAVFAYQRELEVAIVAVAPPHPTPSDGTGAKAKGRSVNVAASSGRRGHPRAERTPESTPVC